uniref:DUF834 domain-containing protein n=1 Tax=Oryza rufipogon TaxID=4529 RepID=A0A0E0QJY9_ORYRU
MATMRMMVMMGMKRRDRDEHNDDGDDDRVHLGGVQKREVSVRWDGRRVKGSRAGGCGSALQQELQKGKRKM